MKGDFTRRTFRRTDRYRGVLLQQGRVQLDADWNEQHDIQRYHDETTARDTIGTHGGPGSAAGFAITGPAGQEPHVCPWNDLTISPGRYYVDGILCENDQPVALGAQPDLPMTEPDADGRYVAYLDVWFDHVTALDRPELREPALGGPDTATRSRTVWQVKLEPLAEHKAVAADVAPPWTPAEIASPRRLRAGTLAPPAPPPGIVRPSAGYRGLRNQLYRVEIHDDGATPTFVWSRDNGAVTARLVKIDKDDDRIVTIDAPPKDALSGFRPGDWVEITDMTQRLGGKPGFLGTLRQSAGTQLTVDDWLGTSSARPDPKVPPITIRRWDGLGALPVTTEWIELEDGIRVQFSAAGRLRCGDYWLIPARTAVINDDPRLTGDVQWPVADGEPVFLEPEGVTHHTAAIALLDRVEGKWTWRSDCRFLFAPLAEVRPDRAEHAVTGLHVLRMSRQSSKLPLDNDTLIPGKELLNGLEIVFDGAPLVLGSSAKQPITVTIDLPYLLSDAEPKNSSMKVLGTRPLALAGTTTKSVGESLLWQPDEAVRLWLPIVAMRLSKTARIDRMLCTLTIDATSFVAGDYPHRVLNGFAISRVRKDGTVELVLPTVDDGRGADFCTWFWLDLTKFDQIFG